MTLTPKIKTITSENGKFSYQIELIHPESGVMGEPSSPIGYATEARAREVAQYACDTQRATGKFPNLLAITE